MEVLTNIRDLNRLPGPAHLAIGVFDGLHLGHQAVIRAARESAANDEFVGGVPVVVTFDPHPVRVLAPDRAPRMLTSTRHQLKLLKNFGIDWVLTIPFTIEFSHLRGEDFVKELVDSCQDLRRICVGANWAFGRDRSGDVALLQKLGAELGFAVTGVPTVCVDDEPASSTRIRQAVEAGDFATAEKFLGRPYTVLGTVIEGKKLGREIGFPTANLTVHSEQLPPSGVYAVKAEHTGDILYGVGNLGLRPTVEGAAPKRLLEVHLFDFQEPIYQDDLEITFLAYLREEEKFPSLDALKAQIWKDAQSAREVIRKFHSV